jgi:hypothetical protein
MTRSLRWAKETTFTCDDILATHKIKQFVLLYPPQGEKGPPRTAYVLSQQTLTQQALVKTLGLERCHRSTPRG